MAIQRRCILAAVIVAVICSVAGQAAGQTSLATLRGKVVDEQGGVLPGATVTIKQAETNFTRTGVTNEKGQYYVPSLPSGSYQVTVELSGFGDREAGDEPPGRPGGDRRLHAQGGHTPGNGGGERARHHRGNPGHAGEHGGQEADRQPSHHQPELRGSREARARRHVERRQRHGLFDRGPAPVPEPGVRRRRHQRPAVLRHAGRVVPAGLGAGIPGDDQRLLRRVRPGVGRRAERHHPQRIEHLLGPPLRLLPQRQHGHAALRRPVQEGFERQVRHQPADLPRRGAGVQSVPRGRVPGRPGPEEQGVLLWRVRDVQQQPGRGPRHLAVLA